MNTAAAPRYVVGGRQGEQTIERESLTDDVQDEEDLEGYGFGV
jgi:hypothetical protein